MCSAARLLPAHGHFSMSGPCGRTTRRSGSDEASRPASALSPAGSAVSPEQRRRLCFCRPVSALSSAGSAVSPEQRRHRTQSKAGPQMPGP